MPWDVIFGPETQPREARVEEGQQLFDGQLTSVLSDEGEENPTTPIAAKRYLRDQKGLSSGLAFKYKGVFEIIGAESNGVDYVLKKINGKGKPFIIHKNRIKIFFGHFMENVEENEPLQTQN